MFLTSELTFVTFILYSLSERWSKTPAEVYKVLNSTGILDGYIIDSYDVLHTLGKEYLVEDITELVREKGVYVALNEPENIDKVLRIHKHELENEIIYNIAGKKKVGMRKAIDIYYSSNIPAQIAKETETGIIKNMSAHILAKKALKRKINLQR